MNEVVINICPVCNAKNPVSNLKCYECGYDFINSNDFFFIGKDKNIILDLLNEDIKFFENIQLNFSGKEKIILEDVEIENKEEEIIEKIKKLSFYFNNSFKLFKYLFNGIKPSGTSSQLKEILTGEKYHVSGTYRDNGFIPAEEVLKGKAELLNILEVIIKGLYFIKEKIAKDKIIKLEIKSDT